MSENQTIKVLLVLPFFYPHRGGSQKYAEELFATIHKNHANVTIDVLCYNTDSVAKYEEYRGFRIYRVSCFNIIPSRFTLANPFSLVWTLMKLSKNKYNFVNTHIRFFDPTWWLWLYAKMIGAKSIFTEHVSSHPVHQSKIVEFVGALADNTLARISLSKYNFITFTNKTAQKDILNMYNLKKPTEVIYGGVDTSFFSPLNKKTRVIPKINKEISDETIVITFVGRLIWTKGVTYLYDAAKSLCDKYPNLLFILAGPGELEQKLANFIQQDKLDSKIVLTGNLNYQQVRDLLGISDIFINPSHHNEGFPNTILEAGASGCFVVATDNAGTWEVIRNNETGKLIPQRDTKAITEALSWAVDNADQRRLIAENFRKILVQEFDWKVISEKLYNLLLKWRK